MSHNCHLYLIQSGARAQVCVAFPGMRGRAGIFPGMRGYKSLVYSCALYILVLAGTVLAAALWTNMKRVFPTVVELTAIVLMYCCRQLMAGGKLGLEHVAKIFYCCIYL